jgi:hypothetical protein
MYFPLCSTLCPTSMKSLWSRSGNMARRPSHYVTTFFLLRTVRGFLSVFLSSFLFLFFSLLFILSLELCSYFDSQFIGTIKLFALINTCNWLVTREKVKIVPHLWESSSRVLQSGHPDRPLLVWITVHRSTIRMTKTKMESHMLTASVGVHYQAWWLTFNSSTTWAV